MKFTKAKCIKFYLFSFVITAIIILSSYNSFALEQKVFITIKINGTCLKPDVEPYIKNDRTMVPIRFIAESLNTVVGWDGENGIVTIEGNEKIIKLYTGTNIAELNGEKQLLDTEIEIINGRTMVPVRYIAESFGCTVDWNQQTLSVLINKEGAAIPAAYIRDRSYTDEDIIWLSRIVEVESKYYGVGGKLGVANVVLNRKNDPRFPNSVYGVIFDNAYCVQFPPAFKEGFQDITPIAANVIAAKMALEGINNIDTCLYFNYKPFENKSEDFYQIIDNQYFYY